jgi:ABC-type dipeptide/oligopeptide/nickel transport system permease component
MIKFLIKRIIDAIPVFIGVAIVAFALVHLSGDPVLLMLPPDATPEEIASFSREMGFDKPILEQFKDFTLKLLRFDFGDSLRYQEPAIDLIFERFPATLQLTVASIVFSVLFAIPAGIISATNRNKLIDYVISVLAMFGQSVPPFWLGLMLILLFSVTFGWLPSSGMGTWQQLILPAFTVGIYFTASIARLTRSGMLEILGSDYIRTARSKGLSNRKVVYIHALRNSLIPIVTMIGLQFGILLGGAVVSETIFAWPGIGRLMVQAIYNRDYPLAQATMIFFSVVFIVTNILVDMLYTYIDPRIKHQ